MARTRKRAPKKRVGRTRKRSHRESAARGREDGPAVTGVVVLDSDGSGRVIADDPERASVYLPPEEVAGVRPGDRVTVRVHTPRRGRPSGRLLEIHARAAGGVAGILRVDARAAHVHLPSLAIRVTELAGARDGEAVVVEIEDEGHGRQLPRGRVTAVLGAPSEARVQAELLIWAQGWPMRFSPEAQAEADAASDPTATDDRHDIREVPHVTIDGADARDFDDAVAAELDGDNIRVWVSIADVSHFVREGSALDRDARERGTSVYFPHRALPMLPERLSSDLCCLQPRRPRFAVTCEMVVTTAGKVADASIYPSLIESQARLTYQQVQAAMDGGTPVPCAHSVALLVQAARNLRADRRERGALDLDIPEAEVILSERGTPTSLRPRARLEAHRLIEDLMIAANEAVARFLIANRAATVFRVHEPPDPRRVLRFATWAQALGIKIDSHKQLAPRTLAGVAAALRKRPQAAIGQALLLRALTQAHYAKKNLGHFALASDAYLHFTSPIRRYPDLLVHRCLRALWRGRRGPASLRELAAQASVQERRAVEAERALVQLAACQVARPHLGEVFDAVVTGVHRAGLFVRTDNLFLEGLLPMEALERGGREDYDVVEEDMALVGRRSGDTFTVGDELEVQLAAVDLVRRHIDFALPVHRPTARVSRRRKKK